MVRKQNEEFHKADGVANLDLRLLETELLRLYRLRKAEQDRLVQELQKQSELESELERVRQERKDLVLAHLDLEQRAEAIQSEARRYRESIQRCKPIPLPHPGFSCAPEV